MRSVLPLSLLAAGLAIACSDRAATSPRAVAGAARDARTADDAADVVIPAPHGFTSQVLSRGHFVEEVDAMFRIKLHEATNVVHVDDPSEMVMAKVTIVPGGALPWHTHPGPALVTIASGELTLVDSHECEVRRYPSGASFMDSGQGHVHTAFNAGATDMVLYVTYLDVPAGQSPLVPTSNPGC